ncbi:MAG: S8 family peptidase [Geminicoccaceae bacterium]
MTGIDKPFRTGFGYAQALACPSLVAVGVAISTLAACSGGGGNGGGNLQVNPNASYLSSVAEPSLPAVAGDWSGSFEYANSTGLSQLNAAEGYARRTGGLPGGQGVRIAIIDSGIDVTHPDLGNLAGTSWAAGGEAISGDSHATFVAGIAGASRTQSTNPNDMHGMAYRATLVNFQASRPSQNSGNGGVSFGTADLVDAIRAASGLASDTSAVESDILNLSLGALSSSDSTFAALRTAMRSAASENKIMVLAAGNEGQSGNPSDKLQPIYPAAYADDTGIAGHAIVVGNLTASNQAAATSNFCGDTRNYCLFAPGSNIRSTLNGGGYGVGSGTSFAAPYVAGAAAVVKAAFPGVSSRDVVDRLLLTAADLGTAGVDDTFGRGRLDLEAAMAPVGPTGFPIGPTVDGSLRPVETSTLRLGPGLTLNPAAKALLARAMAVDGMGFPFTVDLAGHVEITKRDHGLSTFVGNDLRSAATAGLPHARIAAFVSENGIADPTGASSKAWRGEAGDERVPLRFVFDVNDDASVFASINGGSRPRLGLEARLGERRASFMQAGGFLAPSDGLAAMSSGVGTSFRPLEGTEIAVSAFTSTIERDGPTASLQRFEIAQEAMGGVELRLGLTLVQEDEGFIGGSANGIFGEQTSARSDFLTVSFLGPLVDDVDWFTSFSHGRSSIGGGDGALLGDWSDSRSEAFGAGVVIRDVAKEDDGLTLLVGQPLRQKRARASIELPVARQTDGTVVTERQELDFAPKAREISTEIGYRLPLDNEDRHNLQAAGFLRLNPDHDGSRDPEAGFGFAYRWRF